MPTTPNMSLVTPTVGGSLDAWGTILGTLFDLVDAHDHTTGKGVKVPSAALNINADVPWSSGGTPRAITGASGLGLTPVAAASMSAYTSTWFVNSSDANNLYFRSQSGTNIKVTDGSTLNVSIVGGIGGDYAAVGALLDYDDASDTYRLRQQTGASVRQYARMASADVDLFEYKASGSTPVPTNRIRLQSPAALAASYTLTFGAALPGSTSLVQVSAAGALTYSNTVASALALSSTLTVGSTLGVTGLITASAGLTAAAGQHLTVSSTGRFKHGNMTLNIPVGAADVFSGTPTKTNSGQWNVTGAATMHYPVLLPVGARIRSATVQYSRTAGVIVIGVRSSTGGAETTRGTDQSIGTGSGWTTLGTGTVDYTITAGTAVVIYVNFSSSPNYAFGSVEVTYDYP